MGKWTDRLRAQHETTDKTDKTPPGQADRGGLSVLSVNPGEENREEGSFVGFVGESVGATRSPPQPAPNVAAHTAQAGVTSRSTDETDKTRQADPAEGVLSVSSVDPGAENPRQESFVSFVGESEERAPGPTRRPTGDGATPPAPDVSYRSTDKIDKTRRSRPTPDPGGRCERHRRLLTFSEQLFGACSWCVWEDRQGADGRGGSS